MPKRSSTQLTGLHRPKPSPEVVNELSRQELRHISWEQLRIRPKTDTPLQDVHEALLDYEKEPGRTRVDDLRDEMMSFIREHRDRLSLPCSGNCYEHCDGVVIACYIEYAQDQKANRAKARDGDENGKDH